MLIFINEILLSFSSCFSRTAAFQWFVVMVIGFMVRSDSLGVTSVIRDLDLNPKVYPSLIHFFHASSWEWDTIFYQWLKTTARHAPLHRISGRAVLIGDGTKRAVDGKYMPCTKKMVQESESASKQAFTHCHFFGAVGVLIGNLTKIFCMPLSIQIHDGDKAICGWKGDGSVSHVVQMLRDGFRAALYFGRCLFVLDRYFLTVPMLEEWRNESRRHPDLIHVITRAKKNCTAYEQSEEYKGRGRRPVKGKAIHIHELFHSAAASFTSAELPIYGGNKEVRYLSYIYLWGQKLYQPLQFVLVEYEAAQVILVSTDLTMSVGDIIIAYACRFKIETMFRKFKQQFGGLFYHFWTKAVPKLDRYRRKNSPDPLSLVKDTAERERIIRALKATEGYVLLATLSSFLSVVLLLLHLADRFLSLCTHNAHLDSAFLTATDIFRYYNNRSSHLSLSSLLHIFHIHSDRFRPSYVRKSFPAVHCPSSFLFSTSTGAVYCPLQFQ